MYSFLTIQVQTPRATQQQKMFNIYKISVNTTHV